MNGIVVALLCLSTGVESTWESTPQGDQIYVIQLDDEAIAALRAGYPITSVLPKGLDHVGAVRIQFGDAVLQKPALVAASTPADGTIDGAPGTASLAALQTTSPADAYRASQQPPSAPSYLDRRSPQAPTTAAGGAFGGAAGATMSNGAPNPLASGWTDRSLDPESVAVPREALLNEYENYLNAPLSTGLGYAPYAPRQNTAPGFDGRSAVVDNTPPPRPLGNDRGFSGTASTPVGATDWNGGRFANSPFGDFPRSTDVRVRNETSTPGPLAPLTPPPLSRPTDTEPGRWTGFEPRPIDPNYGSLGNGYVDPRDAGYGATYPQSPAGQGSALPYPNYASRSPAYSAPVPSTRRWVLDVVEPQNGEASLSAGSRIADGLARSSSSGAPIRNVSNPSRSGTSRTDDEGTDRTQSGTIDVRAPRSDADLEVQPTDSSVAALGLLFLSVGLNVYFGYLVRGFYLKTRQLARDLRESIVAS